MRVRRAVIVAALALVACSDFGPSSGPGTLRAILGSPNGDEGAALIYLLAEGVLGVNAVGDTEAYSAISGETTRIVLIHHGGGALTFEVELTDVGRPLVALVREVAGPDDQLRSDLSGYRVEVLR